MFPSQIVRHSTVNAAEIAHFSRLSAHWWDERGEFSFLHQMNPVRMQFIREKFVEIARDESDDTINHAKPNVLQGLDVLDVGCGGGLLSESLARLGARTLGIDASQSNIEIAKHHASLDSRLGSNLTYKHTSAEALLNEKKRYDIVCSMEVLEHVDNPTMFLSTCAELVKPSGHLFLSTISRTPLAYLLTIFMAEKVLGKVADGTHTYSKYIKPSELIQYFQSYRSPGEIDSRPWINRTYGDGLPTRTEAEVRGLIYNPLQAGWILAPRNSWGATECNYMFWVRKPS
ncbi:Hexaprenyldihydroxybenzoate methyltransferase, mitochondrial [Paramarasmius palmivorus]|uniref:Ubiquinone biosynthesis O-methyltransferase, mitochondrial n=1 Tax=Paramarasmius palmivorus TaxID=297713 RepID=A0AAW0E9G6_9AGAR